MREFLRLNLNMVGVRVALLAAAVCLSAPLHAQVNQISITCTGTGQLCSPMYSTSITVPQAGTLTLNYTPPATACATWRVYIYLDGALLGTSGFLPPGISTGSIPQNVTGGLHTISLQAEGQFGGCDMGTLTSWGGTLAIQLPNQPPPVPPTITGFTPGSVAAGGPAFTLTVNGMGFGSGAVVQWNGSPLSTVYVGPTQLTASVPAFLIATPGVANIAVLNPSGMISRNSPFAFPAAGTPTVTSVLNFASYTPQLCPGAEAIVNGTDLGTNLAPPPAGTSVTVGNKPGVVVAEGGAPTQIIVQIPFEAGVGPALLTVAFNGSTSAPYAITLSQYCPALLTFSSNGTGNVNAFDETSGSPVTPLNLAKPGDTLNINATGLGPTSPATPTGIATAMNPTATPVSMTIGGTAVPSSDILYAGVGPNVPAGLDTITLKVPNTVQGTQPMVISVGGVSSTNPVTLQMGGITSLVSNASFGSPGRAAPGSIVTIFANGLGKTDQTTGFPSSNFQGVQVTFNGTATPLFHLIASANPQQIDLLVPDELPTSGTVNVQLSTSTGVYPNYPLNMAPAVPALYRLPDPAVQTRFNVIAQFANTAWLALPVSTTGGLGFPACAASTPPLTVCGRPATPGDYLVIYATGLGLATPNGNSNGSALATGAIPPADGSVLYETPLKPMVTIGGVPATVLYSGLAPGFPGEYQVDVQVPSGVANGDDVPVVITMGGLSDAATIAIQPRYVGGQP